MPKVSHNKVKIRAVGDGEIAQSGSWTSDWYDIKGWVDKVVAYDLDPGSGDTNINADIDMDISSHDAYELNNSITEDTGDYITKEIVSAETAGTYKRVSYNDSNKDWLSEPIAAARVKITNNDADENVAANVWIESFA